MRCGAGFPITVLSPRTALPVKFPLKADSQASTARYAVCGWSSHGPTFGAHDVTVRGDDRWGHGAFTTESYSSLGRTYQDTLGHGGETFTGTQSFLPVEMEVFAVWPLEEA